MSSPAQFLRGAVVLCSFPFTERPNDQISKQHFCLVVDDVEHEGNHLVAVCYGTSRLDEDLLRTHAGGVLSVPRRCMRIAQGFMSCDVSHFVLDHVALIPRHWIDDRFVARLDFMRLEKRQNDPFRCRLYAAFQVAEPIMLMAATEAARHYKATGRVGLPSGKRLRHAS